MNTKNAKTIIITISTLNYQIISMDIDRLKRFADKLSKSKKLTKYSLSQTTRGQFRRYQTIKRKN